ncbi:MAG TPA: TonB family protein [Lacunisphaera sp.]
MALFSLVAHVDQARTNPAAPVIEDLRVASLPVEIPPPPVTQTETEPVTEMITGIDVAAAESPVQISLSVPILESPPVPQAPAARIQTTVVPSEFKPRMDLTQEFDHIFQQTEVDQKPTVLANSAPFIPINVHRGVRWLRVVLLMVIDARGVASNIRVLTSSGNAEFDSLIVECVHDKWEFSPAIKKGRKVKCLVQRSVTIRWDSSPFES